MKKLIDEIFPSFPKSKHLRGKNNSDEALKGHGDRVKFTMDRCNQAYQRIVNAFDRIHEKNKPVRRKLERDAQRAYDRRRDEKR